LAGSAVDLAEASLCRSREVDGLAQGGEGGSGSGRGDPSLTAAREIVHFVSCRRNPA
jgi:hypothetical protein